VGGGGVGGRMSAHGTGVGMCDGACGEEGEGVRRTRRRLLQEGPWGCIRIAGLRGDWFAYSSSPRGRLKLRSWLQTRHWASDCDATASGCSTSSMPQLPTRDFVVVLVWCWQKLVVPADVHCGCADIESST